MVIIYLFIYFVKSLHDLLADAKCWLSNNFLPAKFLSFFLVRMNVVTLMFLFWVSAVVISTPMLKIWVSFLIWVSNFFFYFQMSQHWNLSSILTIWRKLPMLSCHPIWTTEMLCTWAAWAKCFCEAFNKYHKATCAVLFYTNYR